MAFKTPTSEELTALTATGSVAQLEMSTFEHFYKGDFDAFITANSLESKTKEEQYALYYYNLSNDDDATKKEDFLKRIASFQETRAKMYNADKEVTELLKLGTSPKPEDTTKYSEMMHDVNLYTHHFEASYKNYLALQHLPDNDESKIRFMFTEKYVQNKDNNLLYDEDPLFKTKLEVVSLSVTKANSIANVLTFATADATRYADAMSDISAYTAHFATDYASFLATNHLTDTAEAKVRFVFEEKYQIDPTNPSKYIEKSTFADRQKEVLAKINGDKIEQEVSALLDLAKTDPAKYATMIGDVSAYTSHFNADYAVFLTDNGLTDSDKSKLRFMFEERFEKDPTDPTKYVEKPTFAARKQEVLDELNKKNKTVDYSDPLKARALKAGTSLDTAFKVVTLDGKSIDSVTQEINIVGKEKLNIQGGQKVSVFVEPSSANPKTLLAISQRDTSGASKPISSVNFDSTTGKYSLSIDAAYYDEVVKGNAELEAIVAAQKTAGSTVYNIPIDRVKLNQDMNIEDITIAGSSTKFSVMFSSLGCQFVDETGKKVIKTNKDKYPFDMAISKDFLDQALINASLGANIGALIGDNLFDVNNLHKSKSFANMLMCLSPKSPGKVVLAEGTTNEVVITSRHLGEQDVTFVEASGKTYAYMHVKDHNGRTTLQPQLFPVKQASIQRDNSNEYLLSIGINDNRHVRILLGEAPTAETLQSIGDLTKGPLQKQFAINASPTSSTKSWTKTPFEPYGISKVYSTTNEGGFEVVDNHVTTLDRNVDETESDGDPRGNLFTPEMTLSDKTGLFAPEIGESHDITFDPKKADIEKKPTVEKPKKAKKEEKKGTPFKGLSKFFSSPFCLVAGILMSFLPIAAIFGFFLILGWGLNQSGVFDILDKNLDGKALKRYQQGQENVINYNLNKNLAKLDGRLKSDQKKLSQQLRKELKQQQEALKLMQKQGKPDAEIEAQKQKIEKTHERLTKFIAALEKGDGSDEVTLSHEQRKTLLRAKAKVAIQKVRGTQLGYLDGTEGEGVKVDSSVLTKAELEALGEKKKQEIDERNKRITEAEEKKAKRAKAKAGKAGAWKGAPPPLDFAK